MDDTIIPVLQVSAQEVLKNEGSEIADMGVIVDRGSAGVKPDDTFFQGTEFFICVAERIV
jgi:hypothetical protein